MVAAHAEPGPRAPGLDRGAASPRDPGHAGGLPPGRLRCRPAATGSGSPGDPPRLVAQHRPAAAGADRRRAAWPARSPRRATGHDGGSRRTGVLDDHRPCRRAPPVGAGRRAEPGRCAGTAPARCPGGRGGDSSPGLRRGRPSAPLRTSGNPGAGVTPGCRRRHVPRVAVVALPRPRSPCPAPGGPASAPCRAHPLRRLGEQRTDHARHRGQGDAG